MRHRHRHAPIILLTSVLIGCEPADRAPMHGTMPLQPVSIEWDIPIELNDAVERWLDYYQTRGRESFEISLGRARGHERSMREALRSVGVPEDLFYVPLVESGFRATAYSRARALGLWQFVPNTARIYELEISYWVDERLDPIAATHAAAEYLEDLQREFGDWYLTLAAYNAGPGRVHRAMRQAESRDYWTLCSRRALRRETRDYIPKLIAAALIAKQPARFGLRVQVQPVPAFDVAYVPDATSLDVVADAAGVSFEEVLALNLHLVRGVTPPGERYPVRIPVGTPRLFAQNYAQVPPSERVRSIVHIVRRGDTLSGIAVRYGASLSAIRAANAGLDDRRIMAGQRLLIPGARNIARLAD